MYLAHKIKTRLCKHRNLNLESSLLSNPMEMLATQATNDEDLAPTYYKPNEN